MKQGLEEGGEVEGKERDQIVWSRGTKTEREQSRGAKVVLWEQAGGRKRVGNFKEARRGKL